jgi:arsenical pump membrane protein
VIGLTSALGSAVINNHSMALTNLLAIRDAPGAGDHEFLAALIGGDLGPRLLPMGSLAGLLWLASLRRLGVEVPLRRFMAVGAAVTVPTVAVSLGLLELGA